ncbi:TPA: hypothetical protein ACG3RL_004297, partial [Clostridioides difficile]
SKEQRVNPFRYTGEMQDALTGHYYLRARFYNRNVYKIYRDSEEDEPTECFGCFDDFVMDYALGDKYRTVVPIDTDDLWVKLLIEGDGKYEF